MTTESAPLRPPQAGDDGASSCVAAEAEAASSVRLSATGAPRTTDWTTEVGGDDDDAAPTTVNRRGLALSSVPDVEEEAPRSGGGRFLVDGSAVSVADAVGGERAVANADATELDSNSDAVADLDLRQSALGAMESRWTAEEGGAEDAAVVPRRGPASLDAVAVTSGVPVDQPETGCPSQNQIMQRRTRAFHFSKFGMEVPSRLCVERGPKSLAIVVAKNSAACSTLQQGTVKDTESDGAVDHPEAVVECVHDLVFNIARQEKQQELESLPPLLPGEYDAVVPISSQGLMMNVGEIHGSVAFLGYRTFPDGSKGPSELSNLIRNVGDRIIAVNGANTINKTFWEVVMMLWECAKNKYAYLRFLDIEYSKEMRLGYSKHKDPPRPPLLTCKDASDPLHEKPHELTEPILPLAPGTHSVSDPELRSICHGKEPLNQSIAPSAMKFECQTQSCANSFPPKVDSSGSSFKAFGIQANDTTRLRRHFACKTDGMRYRSKARLKKNASRHRKVGRNQPRSSLESIPPDLFREILEYMEMPCWVVLASASKFLRKSIYKGSSWMWADLDFESIPATNASRISDESLAALLLGIDARKVTKSLSLRGCTSVEGVGLRPLCGSRTLEKIDLRLARKHVDTFGPTGLNDKIVTSFLASMAPVAIAGGKARVPAGGSAPGLGLVQVRRQRDARDLKGFNDCFQRWFGLHRASLWWWVANSRVECDHCRSAVIDRIPTSRAMTTYSTVCSSCELRTCGQALCPSIPRECFSCMKLFCLKCEDSLLCGLCGHFFCKGCRKMNACSACHMPICAKCEKESESETCDICNTCFCEDCAEDVPICCCEDCGLWTCESCRPIGICELCFDAYCAECGIPAPCDGCSVPVCSECMIYCECCNQRFCSDDCNDDPMKLCDACEQVACTSCKNFVSCLRCGFTGCVDCISLTADFTRCGGCSNDYCNRSCWDKTWVSCNQCANVDR